MLVSRYAFSFSLGTLVPRARCRILKELCPYLRSDARVQRCTRSRNASAGCEYLSQASIPPHQSSEIPEQSPNLADAMSDAGLVGNGAGGSEGGTSGQSGQRKKKTDVVMTVAGFDIAGISIGGQETCIILPQLKLAFDTGRCPQRAVFQNTVLITHPHLDHIGGLPFQISMRAMLSLPPSVVILPPAIQEPTERMLQTFRDLDTSAMECKLVPLEVGAEYTLSNSHSVKPFATEHPVPSQGYVVYAKKSKLKAHLAGLPGNQIRDLKMAGEEVTDTIVTPEVAFTGDTTASFITDPGSADALSARLLIMELTFLDDSVTPAHARDFGHMHIDEFVEHADKFKNERILLIHFSARYSRDDIISLLAARLPPDLHQKCVPMLVGF